MPQQARSDKREHRYEHIKDSAEERGEPAGTAKRIAASTVTKSQLEHAVGGK